MEETISKAQKLEERIKKLEAAEVKARQKAAKAIAMKRRILRQIEGKANEWENHKKYLLGGHLLYQMKKDPNLAERMIASLSEMPRPGDFQAIAEVFEELRTELEIDLVKLMKKKKGNGEEK